MVIAKLMKSIGGKKTAPAKTGAAVKNDGSCVVLDHPQQGEKIASPDYTLRVGTVGDVERVEISIDQGPWLPCRYSVGYWWHDWTGYPAGRTVPARRSHHPRRAGCAARPSRPGFGCVQRSIWPGWS